MLIIYLKETFTNEFDPVTNELDKEENSSIEEQPSLDLQPTIKGKDEVYPFDTAEYTINNISGGI